MMKKTLVAAAVLAAVSGAAMAQSSVTLYGVADVWVGNVSSTSYAVVNGVNTSTKFSQIRMESGGFNGSRWGLRGVEDLGGGLKATFRFESGFNLDSGSSAQGGLLFGREAWVGLEGDFGRARLGRQYTAYDTLYCATEVVYCSNFSPTWAFYGSAPGVSTGNGGVYGNVGIKNYAGRANNAFSYATPNFSGFSGEVVLSTNEDKTANTSTGYNNSLRIQYANGPLLVGYAYQAERNNVAAAGLVPASSSTIRYNLLGSTYNFGVASIQAAYSTARRDTTRDREYRLGVTVPFGAASASLGYANARSQTNDRTTAKGDGFALAGTYDLSKRTTMYAAYNAMRTRTANGTDTSKASVVAVGVRHRF